MESEGEAGRRPGRTRRRRVARVVLIGGLVLLLVAGIGVALAYRHLNGNLQGGPDYQEGLTDRPEKEDAGGPREPLRILVMGSDSREGEGNRIDGETGAGARSDLTILLHLSADRKRAYGVSIPRDSVVQRPECTGPDGSTIPASDGLQMFNAAFMLGGPSCVMQTVEQTTGVRLDHYVVVDFNGFVEMVDALGGVEVCIPQDVDDPAHDIRLEAGTRELDGAESLMYVRERTQLSANSDLGRMKRQQAFLASMANKVVSAGTLANPLRLFNFLDAATRSIKLDKALRSLGRLRDLGSELSDIGLENIQFVTVPLEPWEEDRNRVIWTEDADRLWQAVKADEPIPADLASEGISAEAPTRPSPVEPPSAGPSPGATESPEPSEPAPSAPDPSEVARAHGLCG